MNAVVFAGIAAGWAAVITIVSAVVIHAGSSLVDTRMSRRAERRIRYAEAVSDLIAWSEFPYRIRRRTSDNPDVLASLAAVGSDLQERLGYHEAWILTDDPELGRCFLEAREGLATTVGHWLHKAWGEGPIIKAADMNLGEWGPGQEEVHSVIEPFQKRVQERLDGPAWMR